MKLEIINHKTINEQIKDSKPGCECENHPYCDALKQHEVAEKAAADALEHSIKTEKELAKESEADSHKKAVSKENNMGLVESYLTKNYAGKYEIKEDICSVKLADRKELSAFVGKLRADNRKFSVAKCMDEGARYTLRFKVKEALTESAKGYTVKTVGFGEPAKKVGADCWQLVGTVYGNGGEEDDFDFTYCPESETVKLLNPEKLSDFSDEEIKSIKAELLDNLITNFDASELTEAKDKEEKPKTFEESIDFLVADEEEAIEGYTKVIAEIEDENVKEQLNKILIEEEAHKAFLSAVKEDKTLEYSHEESSDEESDEETDSIEGGDEVVTTPKIVTEAKKDELPDVDLENTVKVSELDTIKTPEAVPTETVVPTEEEKTNALSSIITSTISNKFNELDSVKSILATVAFEGGNEDLVTIFDSIADDATVQIGRLQKALGVLSPKTEDNIEAGKEEAETILSEPAKDLK